MIQFKEYVEDSLEEALNMQQRRQRGRAAKKNRAKMKMGRKRAARKMASLDKLKIRSRRTARSELAKKLTKGVPKGELTAARKAEIEKRLDKMGPRIDRLAKKALPKVRKAEIARKRS